ncbi:hypothetical protein BC937DRAFT_89133 [Endogone sp. FLAS-F59071]|nr:hypothetical protein BC937DRAFT_89133 [Endogone sp. FLAS-F59071]|eukprot:RUS18118.1 hypothetical protein BC937DRAFT_89133 [Endogone sp. FLAS-F59071]
MSPRVTGSRKRLVWPSLPPVYAGPRLLREAVLGARISRATKLVPANRKQLLAVQRPPRDHRAARAHGHDYVLPPSMAKNMRNFVADLTMREQPEQVNAYLDRHANKVQLTKCIVYADNDMVTVLASPRVFPMSDSRLETVLFTDMMFIQQTCLRHSNRHGIGQVCPQVDIGDVI